MYIYIYICVCVMHIVAERSTDAAARVRRPDCRGWPRRCDRSHGSTPQSDARHVSHGTKVLDAGGQIITFEPGAEKRFRMFF